jgi:hypothetical protein
MEVEGSNAFCLSGSAALKVESGVKWVKSDEPPQSGIEIANEELKMALTSKTDFTAAEWDAFKIDNLNTNHYIRAGDGYYVTAEALKYGPLGEFCETDCKECPASTHRSDAMLCSRDVTVFRLKGTELTVLRIEGKALFPALYTSSFPALTKLL